MSTRLLFRDLFLISLTFYKHLLLAKITKIPLLHFFYKCQILPTFPTSINETYNPYIVNRDNQISSFSTWKYKKVEIVSERIKQLLYYLFLKCQEQNQYLNQ